ncbi:hypothetical protein [Pseudomonas akapageensis]|uniref:hypothetical protein n=1 Tax=Pseudomonas akapageensis TaxID=2609961 RepID=UPI001409A3AC|nr:hypothetical protein [Pseudomonas akapageensis]
MSLKDQVDVDHIGLDQRKIQLFAGDVLDVISNDPVDFLFIMCEPNNYYSHPVELLEQLKERGISVAELALQPARDFRPLLPCWISEPVPDAQNVGFRRLVVFEPVNDREFVAALTWQAYQAMRLFSGEDSPKTVAVHIKETADWVPILLRMNFFAAASLGARTPWSTTKLVVEGRAEAIAVGEFTRLKGQYLNPGIAIDEEFEALVKTIGHDCSAGVEAIDCGRTAQELGLTERQFRAIRDYTGPDSWIVNGILRRHKVFDPEYAQVHAFIEAINTGLAQLKNYTEEAPVVRFFGPFTGSEDAYQDGRIVHELAFTSTSKRVDFQWFLSGYKLVLRSRVGKDISSIGVPSEEEVLFGIGMEHRLFDLHDVTDVQGSMTVCLSDQTFPESSNILSPQL